MTKKTIKNRSTKKLSDAEMNLNFFNGQVSDVLSDIANGEETPQVNIGRMHNLREVLDYIFLTRANKDYKVVVQCKVVTQ